MRKIGFIFSSFRTKVALILIASLFFVATLSNFLVYKYALDSQFRQLREKLMIIAQTAALAIDSDLLLQVPLNRAGLNSPSYKIIAKKLTEIKDATPLILYIYTMVKTDQEGIWQFVVDPTSPTEEEEEEGLTSYPGDKFDVSRFPDMLKAFDGPSADEKVEMDEWGATISGYAPVRNEKGKAVAVLGVDMAVEDVYAIQRRVHRRGIFVLALGIIFSLSLGILISSKITERVKKLVEGTRRIAQGDLQYQVKVKGQDELSELARSFNKMSGSLIESRRKLHDYFYCVVQSLVRSLEAKDHYTRGHTDRVAEYAKKIALKMGFSQEKAELLRETAQLHDIGKLGINESILNKNGKLTEEEWKIIQEHPIVGEEILKPVAFDKEMLAMVRSHHERYDGKGYPDKIEGEDINIFAQIVSIADAYDAMTSDRAYRAALSKDEAIEELRENSGTQFNSKIMQIFLDILKEEEG
jgi:putative nucleotidyltransferase with HDIG domain